MERLSIDEIIAHCNRHTDEVEKRQRKTLLEMGDMDYPAMKQYWEHRQVAEYLNELQQYRAIGTVDQCREAVERMKPKKVIVEKDECISKSVTGDEDYSIKYVCPACGSEKLMRGYPCNCGKILDWSE